MTKILAIGTGPLLEKGVKKVGGQCLRTWHFVSPLIEDGHQVALITLPIPDRSRPPESFRESCEKREYDGFSYMAILKEDPEFLYPFLKKQIDRLKPHCIVGINTHPSAAAARAAGHLPLWADLNGWNMAEGQTRARLDKSDEYLYYFWRDERDVCRRADRFSTVTRNQKLALIGELAAMGRLGQYTFDYPFADVVENAVNPFFDGEIDERAEPALRGKKLPRNAFIVLWSGGFNTWTDVNLLYNALAKAMRRDERIHFVSTGGSIDGHDEKTYSNFHRLLAASPFRKRFVLLGWVDAAELPGIYRDCDVGINVDSVNYETLFGARNRITNMMAMGLPVVTTLGTEISHTLKKKELGLAVSLGDADEMAAAINRLAGDGALLTEMSEKCRAFARKSYGYKFTTEALREWARSPSLAPDNARKTKLHKNEPDLLNVWLNDVEKRYALLRDLDPEELLTAHRDLQAIRRKPLFKLYKSFQKKMKRP